MDLKNPHRLIVDMPFSSKRTISYGLIVYAENTKRWIIIQRKHSVEFLLFIKGFYRITHLTSLLSSITDFEKEYIVSCLDNPDTFFENLYLKELDLEQDGLSYAKLRFNESIPHILILLPLLNLSNNHLEWTWPKGRLQFFQDNSTRETPFDCAKREFFEEVEIVLPPPIFISDTFISENLHTLTGRNIESRYWLYIIPDEIPISPPIDHPEVSNRQWVSTDDCYNLLKNTSLFQQITCLIP